MLQICSVRPQIYRNVQKIREIHQTFLEKARAVNPQCVSAASEIDRLFPQGVSRGVQAIDSNRFKSLHRRSLRRQGLKASITARVNALGAQGSEASEIAQEIANMVCLQLLSTYFTLTVTLCSPYHSPYMKIFAATTRY